MRVQLAVVRHDWSAVCCTPRVHEREKRRSRFIMESAGMTGLGTSYTQRFLGPR